MMPEAKLHRFRLSRTQTLSLVRGLTQDQLDSRPSRDRWSVGEVLDHLLLAERFFRGDIQELIARARAGLPPLLYRRLSEFNISPAFVPRPLLPYLEVPFMMISRFTPQPLRDLLLRTRLFPARHPDIAAPRWGRRADDLLEDLSTSLRETEDLLRANADLDYTAMRHVHPLLGSNSVPRLLHLLTLHEQRHQGQILDILRSLPPSPQTGRYYRQPPSVEKVCCVPRPQERTSHERRGQADYLPVDGNRNRASGADPRP